MMNSPKPNRLLAAAVLTALTCGGAQAQEQSAATAEKPREAESTAKQKPSQPTQFLRLQRDSQNRPVALQTAVTRFIRGKGEDRVVVDLVSAVHVGDRAYYNQLNTLFENYDVVLYELVAPKGVRPVPGQERSGNPISFLQNSMKSMLNLESQTELVDYRRKNFVHADMTPTQIAKRMEQRGDSGLSVALDVMADMVREMNRLEQSGVLTRQAEQVDLMTLLFDDNSDQKLKLMLAEQFVAQGTLSNGLGETLNRMLVTDRNEVAMGVLAKELEKGRRKVAIFYGAAHMPDFEKRLKSQQKMRLKKNRWVTAWDLTKQSTDKQAEPDPLKLLLKLLDEAPE